MGLAFADPLEIPIVDSTAELTAANAYPPGQLAAVRAEGYALYRSGGLTWSIAVSGSTPFTFVDSFSGTDTVAVHAARDLAGVGGTVLFSKRAYSTTGLTASVASQKWDLSGATITLTNTANAPVITSSAAGVTVVGPGTLNGNRVNQTTTGRGVSVSADNVTVRDLTITSTYANGIFAGSGVDKLHIFDVYITDTRTSGINVNPSSSDVNDLYIRGCTIDRSAEAAATIDNGGIDVAAGGSTAIRRTKIQGNTIILPTSPTDGSCIGIEVWGNSDQCNITGNTCIGGAMGISVAKSDTSTTVSNIIIGASGRCLELADSSWCTVANNVCDGGGLAQFGLAGSAQNNGVSHNTITGNTFSNLGAGGEGIYLGASDPANVMGNVVVGNNITTNGGGLGIWIQSNHAGADLSRNLVVGNIIEGDGTGDGIRLDKNSGTFTHTVVSANIFRNLTNGINQNGDDQTVGAGNQFDTVSNPYAGTGTNRRRVEPVAGSAEIGSTIVGTTGGLWRVNDGALATPSFSFVNDTDTGMFLAAADQLRFATGGVTRATFNSTAINFGTNRIVGGAPNSALADGSLAASTWTAYLNEAGSTLTFKVKYADGTTVKTGTVALT
jgi:parallel beta-helix repeat protein